MTMMQNIGRALVGTGAKLMQRGQSTLTGPNVWNVFGNIGGSNAGVAGKLFNKVPGTDKPAENFLWAYNCIIARSEAMMQAPVRISDDNDQIVESGALWELMRRPSRSMDGVQWVAAVEAMLARFNQCYILPVGEKDGKRPDELLLLNPRYLTPMVFRHKVAGIEVVGGYIYRDPIDGREHKFLDNELIAIKVFNPDNPYVKALDPMSPLKRTLLMDGATRDQNLALFLNGGLVDYALVTPKQMTPDQAEEFLDYYNSRHQGFDQSHKTTLLYNDIKPHNMGLKPQDLQSLETLQQLTPQEICAGLRTKPAMAGLMVGETGLSEGTSTTEQKIAWWSETGHADQARIMSALGSFLVDAFDWSERFKPRTRPMEFGERAEYKRQTRNMGAVAQTRARATGGSRLRMWFDTSRVPELMEYRWKRTETFASLRKEGYRPDDLNQYLDLGLPPHDTNEGILPFSVQPVGDVVSGGSTEPERAGKSEQTGNRAALRDKKINTLLGVIEGRAKVASKLKGLRRTMDKFIATRQKENARKHSRFYMEQRKRVLDRLGEMEQERGRDQRDVPVDEFGEDEILKRVFPKDAETDALYGRLSPIWSKHLADGYQFFADEETDGMNVPGFLVDDPRVAEAITKRKINGAMINDTTENDLRKIIQGATKEGITTAQLGDRIATYYADNCVGETKARPQAAANTQVTGVVNDGRMLAADKVGGLLKGWLHGGSSEPRDAHLAAEAEYLSNPIPLNQDFVVNGHNCKAPGDSSLPASESVNCTCIVVFEPEN